MSRSGRSSKLSRRAMIRALGAVGGAGAWSLLLPADLRAAAWVEERQTVEKTNLVLGFIPLTDCAPLVVALEKGFFAQHGLNVRLSREPSWANIRDKVAAGAMDGAHMLAPLPIAMTLGAGARKVPMVTALSLDLNGSAVTVSNPLFARMAELDPEGVRNRPVTARALRRVIAAERASGKPPMTFGVVFPMSSHNYLLRYWMAAGGIDPDRDVRIVVVPPPQMVESLRAGHIVGYCVGEPWNEVAVVNNLGHLLITSHEIWNHGPEKVLGVTRQWAERNPETHISLIRALLDAAKWLDEPENRTEAARLIAQPAYVNAPEDVVRMSMTGKVAYNTGESPVSMPEFHVFYRNAATFPWRSHAEWFLSQMVRWGHTGPGTAISQVAVEVYRPDVYRMATAGLDHPHPTVDRKPEGLHGGPWTMQQAKAPIPMGPDRFFDGMAFDPSNVPGYLAGFPMPQRETGTEGRFGVPA